ncbi:MAG: hypothetical protein JWN44_2867 [Myxococcales bacterium]|nr:hypothetical protein [Myxococcales bacterium]
MMRTAAMLAGALAMALSPGAVDARELGAADLDRAVAAEWRQRHLKPGPVTDDAAFLRRLTIDLTGTLPSADAVREFLADARKDKRARAVDVLLGSPAYAQHWAGYWDKLLMGRTAKANPILDRPGFVAWLRTQVAANRPWNQVVYDLITATGESHDQPATNWILRYAANPTDLTGKMSRLFLGVQIQCAQCHDHPSEKWKQDDFRALTAAFARTGAVPLEDKVKGQRRRVELRDQPGPTFGGPKSADLRLIALTAPRALDGTDLAHADNRRVALAEWLTRPANPYFARALVNRYWAHLVGRGFVEPVDDFRRSNPPVMPALLESLAADFTAHQFDIQRLIRLIVNTRVYQLAVVGGAEGDVDEQLFVHHRMRPLTSEELYSALASATNLENGLLLAGLANLDALKQQLQGAFEFLFSVDEEGPPPADFAGSIQQALLFLNGKLVSRAAAAVPGMALSGILDFPAGDEARVEALYLRTLSRPPTAAERTRWVAYVNAPRDVVVESKKRQLAKLPRESRSPKKNPLGALERAARKLDPSEPTATQQAYEDLFWALLNSSEFTFQH